MPQKKLISRIEVGGYQDGGGESKGQELGRNIRRRTWI
jgi:hypothetical protein